MSTRSLARRALAWIALAAAVIAVLELGTRAFLWARGDPYDGAAVRAEVARSLDEDIGLAIRKRIVSGVGDDAGRDRSPVARGERFLHPYFGWDTDEGLRNLETSLSAAKERRADVRILLVGGRVAEAIGRDASAIGRIEELLHADARFAGKRIAIWAAGREGFKGPQPVNVLTYALNLGWIPDAVVNVDGFDAVAFGDDNANAGVSPVFPAAEYWSKLALWGTSNRRVIDAALDVRRSQRATERWARAIQTFGLAYSAVLGDLALKRLRDLHGAFAARASAYETLLNDVADRRTLRGPRLDADERDAIESSASAWMECSRCLSALCRGRGIPYVHVLHPALHDAGSKPFSARDVERSRARDSCRESWKRGVELGYPMLREKGAELARLGIAFVDASSMFASTNDEMYVDGCRLGDSGLRALAERIGHELAQRWPAH